jgi:hypothetical protein
MLMQIICHPAAPEAAKAQAAAMTLTGEGSNFDVGCQPSSSAEHSCSSNFKGKEQQMCNDKNQQVKINLPLCRLHAS